MLGAGVAHDVDDMGPVAQVVQLVEGEEAHAGVVGFPAEDAVELNRMADGFVDLQAELAAVQDQIEFALGALVGASAGPRLPRRYAERSRELQFVDSS